MKNHSKLPKAEGTCSPAPILLATCKPQAPLLAPKLGRHAPATIPPSQKPPLALAFPTHLPPAAAAAPPAAAASCAPGVPLGRPSAVARAASCPGHRHRVTCVQTKRHQACSKKVLFDGPAGLAGCASHHSTIHSLHVTCAEVLSDVLSSSLLFTAIHAAIVPTHPFLVYRPTSFTDSQGRPLPGPPQPQKHMRLQAPCTASFAAHQAALKNYCQ
jgi:hypothetical protein